MKNNMNKYKAAQTAIKVLPFCGSGAFIRNLPGSSQCKRLSAGYVSADCF